MNVAPVLFYSFEVLAALTAACLLFTKNVFYGALLVIVCLLSLAGIYVLAFAEFIAVTQILVYAGGILVVIIFGIMLTSKISGNPLISAGGNYIAGFLVSGSILTILIVYFSKTTFTASGHTSSADTIELVGLDLMTTHALPFELAGILLLVALIGAAVTATSAKSNNDVPH